MNALKPAINVMVVEDRPNSAAGIFDKGEKFSRRELYAALFEQEYCGHVLKYTLVNSIEKFHKHRMDKFDVVISDVALDEGGFAANDFGLLQAVGAMRARFPIFLISGKWDEVVQNTELREVLRKQEIIKLWSLPELFKAHKAGHLDQYRHDIFQAGKPRQYGDQPSIFSNNFPTKGDDETINLLHISDTQFCPEMENKHLFDYRALAMSIKEELNGQKVDLVILSGDVVERGLPSEYELAKKHLFKFINLLTEGDWTLPSKRLIVVPGNHDLNMALANSRRIGIDSSKKLRLNTKEILKEASDIERFNQYAFDPFWQFAKEITGSSESPNELQRRLWNQDFAYLGLLFLTLNTSKTIGGDGWYVPNVLETDIENAADEFTKLARHGKEFGLWDVKDLIKIGILHHPISHAGTEPSKNPKEQITNSELFKDQINNGVLGLNFVCCGHVHKKWASSFDLADNPKNLLQLCSSTLLLKPNKRPEDSFRGCNLISLKRKEKRLESLLNIPFEIGRGQPHVDTKNVMRFQWKKDREYWDKDAEYIHE
ncbi:metallophosphoesterase family protein [Terasakiella pusilla]|uniref:metallophosphoesterase family protein n=1 Tax=Terasakiella pusilla TaxID=64973 RepID=UPI003AA8987C